jgi:5-(carboxyamino)imidazole ribonucleotide synthase
LKPVLPGATIGLLGGGQLGRMLALEGRPLGYRFISFDPAADGPAAQVCDDAVVAPFSDLAAAQAFASRCDVVTFEWENIPADLLDAITAKTGAVWPASAVLRVIQDRWVQREFLKTHGLPQTEYLSVDSLPRLEDAANELGYPCILKTRRHGYDGKGQLRLASAADLAAAAPALTAPLILEKHVPFVKEISVILVRTEDGRTAVYPIAENVHRNGILHTTRAPAPLPDDTARRARELALKAAAALGHVGVMAVEMFVLRDNTLLINEIAPRVHNSGHFTYGACATSQFEQHVRAICGLPLGTTDHRVPSVMINLLGDLWSGGEPRWEAALSRPDVKLHLYGKAEAKPGRKMGHLLVLGDAVRALADADSLLASLRR